MRTEAWDPELQFSWTATPWRCHACAAQENAVKPFRDDQDSSTAGLYVTVARED